MKRLKSGDRIGSIGVVMGLVAVLMGCAGLILFVLDTRETARISQQVAREAVESEQRLRALIQSRCESRQAYDQRFVRAAAGDEKFYADLLSISDRAAQARTEPVPVAIQKLIDEQRQVILTARKAKQQIVAEGVIGNCSAYSEAEIQR